MNKLIASLAASAVLTCGAVAAATVLPLAGAGAQEGAPVADHPRPGALILDKALDKLVANGVLTEEQAQAVRTAVGEEAAAAGFDGRPGPGPGIGPRGRELIERAFAVSAETIGVDVGTLQEAVRSGDSVASVAADNGVEAQAVIDALVKAGTQAIDERVADGTIPEEMAAAIKERLPEGAERFVMFTRPG